MTPEGKALVTGASRGMGRAISLELAARGFDVLATMRDVAAGETLRRECPERIEVGVLDVDQPGSFEPPDELRVLVNNAGVETDYLPGEHAPLSAWRQVFETNLFGLVEVTRRAIPALRQGGGGVLCNVTSSSLLFPMPFYGVYRASKAAVAASGESLAAELRPQGVRVLEILPGPIATDMLEGSARVPEAAEDPHYRALATGAHQSRAGAAEQTTSAEDAARAIVDAILDDDSPQKVGCDPLARAMLGAAGAQAAEAMHRGVLAAMPDD